MYPVPKTAVADDTTTPQFLALVEAAAQDKAKLLFESAMYRILISIEQEAKAARATAEEALDNVIGLAMMLLPDDDDDEDEGEEQTFTKKPDEDADAV